VNKTHKIMNRMNHTRILIVGSGQYRIYEKSLLYGFESLNCNVDKFWWSEQLNSCKFFSLYRRVRERFLLSPMLLYMNALLKFKIKNSNYDFVFIYRGTHILPATVKFISNHTNVYVYNNDDPFGESMPKYYWRHFLSSLKYANHIFSYRTKNIIDYSGLGLIDSSILMSSFDPRYNYYINYDDTLSKEYDCDVIFIGHFENDGRDYYLLSLMKRGYSVKIFGGKETWVKSKIYYQLFSNENVILLIDDYNLAINSAKIALNFLSKVNNDDYTRRCFEITATKTLLLSEYSDYLSELFIEDKEIVFFNSEEELVYKVNYLLNNEEILNDIALAGYSRTVSNHSINNRAMEILDKHNELKDK
jgi:spore maturation protein CgeB